MYLCIDMKCFFASVECAERGLNPLTTPLVVANPERGGGALCLAVSPFLKQQGIKNRGRVYEIPKEIPFIIAKPRMKKYMEYAVKIHRIFLKYVAAEDIHTYSIDEAFLYVKEYLHLYSSVAELAVKILKDIEEQLGIIAACGCAENLFLAKVSLDLLAKKSPNNFYYLSLEEYFNTIWYHPKLTDIWQIGRGISKRLHNLGIYTLHDLALTDKAILIKEFGVVGTDLYEYAWGIDKTTIADIKSYQPLTKSFSRGQILFKDYQKYEAWIPLQEMLFLLCMDLHQKKVWTNHLFFYIGYSNSTNSYHKSFGLNCYTDDYFLIKTELKKQFDKIPEGKIRRLGLSFGGLVEQNKGYNTLFYQPNPKVNELCNAIDYIWQRHGKNKLVLGTAIQPESTIYQRNKQIGGHNSD